MTTVSNRSWAALATFLCILGALGLWIGPRRDVTPAATKWEVVEVDRSELLREEQRALQALDSPKLETLSLVPRDIEWVFWEIPGQWKLVVWADGRSDLQVWTKWNLSKPKLRPGWRVVHAGNAYFFQNDQPLPLLEARHVFHDASACAIDLMTNFPAESASSYRQPSRFYQTLQFGVRIRSTQQTRLMPLFVADFGPSNPAADFERYRAVGKMADNITRDPFGDSEEGYFIGGNHRAILQIWPDGSGMLECQQPKDLFSFLPGTFDYAELKREIPTYVDPQRPIQHGYHRLEVAFFESADKRPKTYYRWAKTDWFDALLERAALGRL